jgi:hypothetical protein
MASLYFECSGSVVTVSPDTLQCSSGFVQVSEPTFTLITAEQGSALLGSIITLFVVVAVFKKLAHLF